MAPPDPGAASHPVPVPRGPRDGPVRRRILLWGVLFVALVHGAVVLSILSQPIHWQGPGDDAERWLLDPIHFDSVHRQGPFADFFALYHAGVAVRHGFSPYDYSIHEPIYVTPYYYPFRYLPATLPVARGMVAAMGPEEAAALWVVLCAAGVWSAIAVFLRSGGPFWFRLLALGVLGLGAPFFLEYYMGQFTFAAAALVLAALALAERSASGGRWVVVGFQVAVAALLKVFPLAVIPALARSRGGVVVSVGAVAVVLATTGWYFRANPGDWVHFAGPNFRAPIVPEGGNFGLVQLLAQGADAAGWLESGPVSWFLRTGIKALLLGLAAGVAFLARGVPMTARGALLLVAYGLSYHHVWEHHYSAWILASLVLLGWMAGHPGRRRWEVALAVGCVVVMALPTLYPVFEGVGDRSVWDPTEAWPAWQRALMTAQKAVPLLTVFLLVGARMVSGGLARPWGEQSRLAHGTSLGTPTEV